ncbi:hypothetical protein H0H87_012925 [Tephrocybe sp. NHM501043]|nr:hypothetical protein H0H87_012925 [Tephrocybe sp. NHM501043]
MAFDDESYKLPSEEAEEHAKSRSLTTSGPVARYKNPLVGIRVLGFLLMDLYGKSSPILGQGPYRRLCKEGSSCLREESGDKASVALQELGLHYRNHLMRVFRSNAGPRPASSAHVSRPSFDVARGQTLMDIKDVSNKKSSPRDQALLRDGYKCTLCGYYDQTCVDTYPEVYSNYDAQPEKKQAYTEVAHILSESVQDGGDDYAAAVFTILKMFNLEEQAKGLYGAGVNGLQNVITMDDNTYEICGVNLDTLPIPFKSNRITFTVDASAAAHAEAMGVTIPLPDRTMLALRAACSRVARMSGAAEHIDLILREREDITVLADDGSMADLLSFCLTTAQPRALQAQG